MGKLLKRTGAVLFIVFISVMLGVQWMSEQYGLSNPKPLQLEGPGSKPSMNKQVTSKEKKEKKVRVPQTDGMTNAVSELGQVAAEGSQSVMRGGLESLLSAIQRGLSKEE